MTIREATVHDVPQLVAMGRHFLLSTAYAGIVGENDVQMRQTAVSLIEGEASVVLVAEDRGGVLAGMIGLLLFPHHISGEMTAGEVFWWSEAPGMGIRLLRRAEQWAKDHGAAQMSMIQPDHEPRVGDLYQRLGFQRIEVAWQKSLSTS